MTEAEIQILIGKAVAEEREACAKIVETGGESSAWPPTAVRSRHPDGWLIGRQTNPTFWEFYNPPKNGKPECWAGSGHVYVSAVTVLRRMQILMIEEEEREL